MNDRFSTKLMMIHNDGSKIYPVKMKDRNAGRIAFRLSNKGNTKTDSIEIECEQEMITKVVDEGFAVRASTLNGDKNGLYRINKNAISDYILKDI